MPYLYDGFLLAAIIRRLPLITLIDCDLLVFYDMYFSISSCDCLCVKICISSHVVGPRHPLRKDPSLDYDVSSDEEWEEVH